MDSVHPLYHHLLLLLHRLLVFLHLLVPFLSQQFWSEGKIRVVAIIHYPDVSLKFPQNFGMKVKQKLLSLITST